MIQAVEYPLQDGGADIEARDEEGMTALLRACGKGHVGAIQTLIENKADVYAVDKMRRSCLFYAAHENQHKVHREPSNTVDYIATVLLGFYLHDKVAAIFLRNRDTRRLMYVADTSDMVPLHTAAWNGHLEVIS